MKYDIGMICSACGCVTIFQVEDNTPRRCARCHDVDTPLAPPYERPAPPVRRGRRPEASSIDWME